MSASIATSWMIRASLLCLAAVAARVWLLPDFKANAVWRLVWTTGFCLSVLHVVMAFQTYHSWSHREAALHTAAKTQALLGWSFAGGIYFNYLFLAVWAVDLACWWTSTAWYKARSWRWDAVVHGYLLFIAINGAVVFEDGVTRAVGAPLTILLLLTALVQGVRARRRKPCQGANCR